MEAIILAGGLGTRLRSEVQDLPKSMAAIQSRPFMEYLLDRLISNGISHIVFSVGYKSEHIQQHFKNKYRDCSIVYAVEEQLLGTGGAIKNAMQFIQGEDVLIVNGDSIFFVDLQAQLQFHKKNNAAVTLALKPMTNIQRYGTVEMTDQGRITRFLEKQPITEGHINTGTYIFNVNAFKAQNLPEIFSIEREYFETRVDQLNFMGYPSTGYFLDIGIPKDFRKAQYEIGIFPFIDESWTLFLDRDGVINKKRDNDYVKSLAELELLPGAIRAIAHFSKIFGRIVVVTNQQGIGKKLMTTESLDQVHDVLIQQVKAQDGNIDAVYYAPQLAAAGSTMRKPEIGMALQAQKDFPAIDFSKSIMIGDSPSDMTFGKNAGMNIIFIAVENSKEEYAYTVSSLAELSNLLQTIW